MVNIIQDNLKGITLEESLETIARLEKIDPGEDLNKVREMMLSGVIEACKSMAWLLIS